jgi:hypothetical protein
MSLQIEKDIPIGPRKNCADPECYEIAKKMQLSDSVVVGDRKRANILMRYIGRLHPETSGGHFEGGAISRSDSDGNIRVWRVNYHDGDIDF